MIERISNYRHLLNKNLEQLIVTDSDGKKAGGFEQAVETIAKDSLLCNAKGGEVLFIGNGGSAAICNHCAIDWWNNGKVRTRVFFGDLQLTCLANDFGYESVFSRPIEELAKSSDLLIAISSSGRSPNILNGVKAARKTGMRIITLSGFSEDNPLRNTGDVNIYVPTDEYGFAETVHGIILHAASDAFEEIRDSAGSQ